MDVAGCWRYSRGYVGGFLSGLRESVSHSVPVDQPVPIVRTPDLDDPEVLLSLAQQEMKETQARNGERVVQAITQKNNLQAEVDKTQKMVANLQAKAELARVSGDSKLELQLLAEKERQQAILTKQSLSLTTAIEIVDQMRTAMRQEEERVRIKNAQAMALKAEWKQHQVLSALELAANADGEAALRPVRHEVRAFVAQAHRLSDELWQMAERALRNGNRALARAILMERAAFQNAFSDPS